MPARLIAVGALAALLLAGPLPASAPVPKKPPVKSGPQVGEGNNRGAFIPLFITGPHAGKKLCPV